MTAVRKIDSNVTGLRYAEEASIGALPVTPIWYPFEPNSYNDFGGDYSLISRRPINADRQRRKGVITDLDAMGGFESDLLQLGLQDIMQGFFFASLRRKGEEIVTAVDIDSGNPDEYEVASNTGFYVGTLIKGVGFTNSANNAMNVVRQSLPDGVTMWRYLSDEDAWFVKTDCPEGLTHYTRMAVEFDEDSDFDTKNRKYSAVERWSQGWSNWRGIYGSAGS